MKDVQVQGNNAVAVSAPPQTQILASDVVVPRLLLMQGTSDFVKDRKAQLGDMVRSTNTQKLGDPDKLLQIVPLAEPTPTWIIECRPKGEEKRWSFKGIEPRNAMNDGLAWKFDADKDGKPLPEGAPSPLEWRRVKCLTLYAILPDDVDAFLIEEAKAAAGEMPDISKALTPVMISFRSTSFKAGKEVSTFFTDVAQFRMEAWRFSIGLTCFLDKNDQGTYYVFKVDRSKPAPIKKEHVPRIEYWSNIVRTTTLRVDETGAEGGDEPSVGGSGGNF